MDTLKSMLAAYRHGADFPTYDTLRALAQAEHLAALGEVLDAYRLGAPFPTYAALVALSEAR